MKETIEFLRNYIPKSQLDFIVAHMDGDEGEYFREILEDARKAIESMPPLYANEELGTKAMVKLHYFGGATDFWFSELDREEGIAFGYACLNGDRENAELGYSSIPEIIACDGCLELDLHWSEKPLEEVMKG